MDTRTVYRYENWQGNGPYRAGSWPVTPEKWQAMCDSHTGLHHPAWLFSEWNPEIAGYGPDEMTYGYGQGEVNRMFKAACNSREALDAWFDGWHDALKANGFHVVEYTVPAENVVDGHSGLQVAFLPV